MADFPNSVKSFATLVDLVDDVLAAHQNERGDEITAIESYLLEGIPESASSDIATPSTDKVILYVDDNTKQLATKDDGGNITNYGVNNVTPYRLSVFVSSNPNRLTVALKDKDGGNPSKASPVKVQIGDTVRTITSTLFVTKNAGTNWCNSGSAELATKEVDYFVYLGYNATDGVVIGFSRIPYASVYSDFSATTTNERYAAISTITNAAAGDTYTLIGRFAATLSAGAGYTWTVPTFTNVNLKHVPVYETRWLTWTPTNTGFSSDPTLGLATYQIMSQKCYIQIRHSANGTSNAATFTMTLPMGAATLTNAIWGGTAQVIDNGAAPTTPGILRILSAATVVDVGVNYSGVGGFTASGGKRLAAHATPYWYFVG